jgi:hypothetical protein
MDTENTDKKEQTGLRRASADGSVDLSLAWWCWVGVGALAATLICILAGSGTSAIATSIVFATSIYAYRHNI